VAIENPSDRLRPEMLCRAEFIGPENPADSGFSSEQSASSVSVNRITVFAPVASFTETDSSSAEAQGNATVWKVDASGDHVVPQLITLGREVREDFRRVLDGLKPGDRVVLNPPSNLEVGDRFRPLNTSGAAQSQLSTDQ